MSAVRSDPECIDGGEYAGGIDEGKHMAETETLSPLKAPERRRKYPYPPASMAEMFAEERRVADMALERIDESLANLRERRATLVGDIAGLEAERADWVTHRDRLEQLE